MELNEKHIKALESLSLYYSVFPDRICGGLVRFEKPLPMYSDAFSIMEIENKIRVIFTFRTPEIKDIGGRCFDVSEFDKAIDCVINVYSDRLKGHNND